MDLWTWGSNEYAQMALPPSDLKEDHTPHLVRVEQHEAGGMRTRPRLLAAGGAHTVVVADDGCAIGWGLNSDGQLPTAAAQGVQNARAVVSSPTCLPPLRACVRCVATGFRHTVALSDDGDLLAFGSNAHGQLGGADQGGRIPSAMPACVQVAAGVRHSLTLAADGQVYGFGDAAHGQLGRVDSAPKHTTVQTPMRLRVPARIVSAACGLRFSALLDERGSVWMLGDVRGIGCGSAGTTDAHNAGALAVQRVDEIVRGEGGHVQQLSCGWGHMAVRVEGRVVAFGRNVFGQCGHADDAVLSTSAVAVCCGSEHSAVLQRDGSLATFGWNEHRQLGCADERATRHVLRLPHDDGSPPSVQMVAAGGSHTVVATVPGAS